MCSRRRRDKQFPERILFESIKKMPDIVGIIIIAFVVLIALYYLWRLVSFMLLIFPPKIKGMTTRKLTPIPPARTPVSPTPVAATRKSSGDPTTAAFSFTSDSSTKDHFVTDLEKQRIKAYREYDSKEHVKPDPAATPYNANSFTDEAW